MVSNPYICIPLIRISAQMAELVDASDSKSGIGNNVQVRFLFWALSLTSVRLLFFMKDLFIQ